MNWPLGREKHRFLRGMGVILWFTGFHIATVAWQQVQFAGQCADESFRFRVRLTLDITGPADAFWGRQDICELIIIDPFFLNKILSNSTPCAHSATRLIIHCFRYHHRGENQYQWLYSGRNIIPSLKHTSLNSFAQVNQYTTWLSALLVFAFD